MELNRLIFLSTVEVKLWRLQALRHMCLCLRNWFKKRCLQEWIWKVFRKKQTITYVHFTNIDPPQIFPGYWNRNEKTASPGFCLKWEANLKYCSEMRGEPRGFTLVCSERGEQASRFHLGSVQKWEASLASHLGTIQKGEPSLHSNLGFVQKKVAILKSQAQKREASLRPFPTQ
jgi:hypothetical protein